MRRDPQLPTLLVLIGLFCGFGQNSASFAQTQPASSSKTPLRPDCRNQAFSLTIPSMSEKAIFRQQSCNFRLADQPGTTPFVDTSAFIGTDPGDF